jgi:hypothetical protein
MANVAGPQDKLRKFQPDKSSKGMGCVVLSPETFSLPQAYSWGPDATQKLLVLPAPIWTGAADKGQKGLELASGQATLLHRSSDAP